MLAIEIIPRSLGNKYNRERVLRAYGSMNNEDRGGIDGGGMR